MTIHRWFIVLSLAVAASTAEAAPRPWCSTPGVEKLSIDTNLASIAREPEAHRVLYALVAATCVPDREATANAAWVDKLRLTWSQKLHLTEDDWADVAQWATEPLHLRMDSMFSRADDKLAPTAYSSSQQFERMEREYDPAYFADLLGDRLTQAGRMGYVMRCLQGPPLAWAMCASDIAALDPAKLSSEVRSDARLSGFERTRLRIEAHALAPQLAGHAKKVRELVDKEPGYAQMFAVAKTASATFAKASPTLVAMVTALDDARATRSRRATDGCREKTWTALSQVVSAIPAKQFTGLEHAVTNPILTQAFAKVVAAPDGYLAALAVTTCASLENKADYLVNTLGALLGRWPGYRGPRTTAHTMVLAAGIQFDDRDLKIEGPDVDRTWLVQGTSSRGGGTGTVESLKVTGDKLILSYAKIKGTQQRCVRGHHTHRITQIRSDGAFVYEYVCLEERTETYAEPPAPPQTIDPRYAEGLKPGMFVTNVEEVIILAFAKGAKIPSFVAGIPVK
ncbi:MAG: hypothetical protein ACKV2T_15900 [Kofleriaceae bacterium]